ncbi:hypothetical protein K439DRAFT_1663409 [Ramaria rubella]|nr:hypothetical protein K439DRAFT_1663409 [Ramaria rubella]
MQASSIPLSSTLSEAVIVRYSTTTLHPYKCDWNGCKALLNCWLNLQKHLHWHCKNTLDASQSNHVCGVRFCTLDKHRSFTMSSLLEHIEKIHLLRMYLPCLVGGCNSLQLPERIYTHFLDEHTGESDTMLAPQALPFQPTSFHSDTPLPVLPQDLIPIHSLIPLVNMSTGLRGKRALECKSTTASEAKKYTTLWSCFAFDEHNNAQELESVEYDLSFEPLHRPTFRNEKAAWPELAISAQPKGFSAFDQISAPLMVLPPSRLTSSSYRPSPSFLYDAFKNYLEAKDSQ